MSRAEQQWRTATPSPEEVEIFQCRLLVSELFTLVPVGVAPPAWQRWQHPSGVAAVPCFLSEASARLAARESAQVVRVPGRDLFASLDSAAAWVDPEGVPLLILSEQLQALMASQPAPPAVGKDSTLEAWSGASDLPSELRSAWCALLPHFPFVATAYWLGRETEGRLPHRRLVIVTQAASGDDTARALDALSGQARASFSGRMRIESQALELGELPTAQQRLEFIEPFYLRD